MGKILKTGVSTMSFGSYKQQPSSLQFIDSLRFVDHDIMMQHFRGLGVGHVYVIAKPQPYVTVVPEVQPSTSNHDLEPIEPELTLAEDEDDEDCNEAELLRNGDSDDLD